ncbi:MAG: adenylate/guanylate cyclase domain-containing protein [Croceitalea sp.]|nr:adenylate/guanylate cyclase domain-containing protein [Croceitalea sp.]
MLTYKTKRNIARILPFGIIWLVFGWVFLLIEHAALDGSNYFPTTAIQLDFRVFMFASLAVTLVGLSVGAIELLFLNKRFTSKTLLQKIIYKLLFYICFLFLVMLIAFPVAASIQLQTTILDQAVWIKFIAYLSSITLLSTAVQLSVSLVASLLYSEISENLGQGVLLNFFTGKYHTPKEENRIFMFADMKSSTTIAEKLGHIEYFELLKTYYQVLAPPIVKHAGEVYQYVGDEIVISWKLKNGLENNNCLRAFFEMQRALTNHAEIFEKRFGLMPSFKAGLHYGLVTTGEIGELKKDIIFTGDVLNATARLQSMCNDYRVDNIISSELLEMLNLNDTFKIQTLGTQELKGKKEKVSLATLSLNEG